MDLLPFVKKTFEKTPFRKCQITGELMPRLLNDRLYVPPELIAKAAEVAFGDMAFYFRPNHLARLAKMLNAPDIGGNDSFVIENLLTNAVISAKEQLPHCQDTGTAIVYAWKDEGVYTGADDRDALEKGAEAAYKNKLLRFSQFIPASFFNEFNSGNNLPAQIHIEAAANDNAKPSYRFLFAAKGGGSTNKTTYIASTPALLGEAPFRAFLEERIRGLGTAGCPPYQLAIVAGGASPEQNLELLKLATTEILDEVPYFDPSNPNQNSHALFRDRYWEDQIKEIGRNTGLGAQFGGTNFILDVRVLRLGRHAATFPVSIGVSCIAHRNMLAVIDSEGLRIEQLVNTPETFLKEYGVNLQSTAVTRKASAQKHISLEKPMREVCSELSALKTGDMVLLSGKLIVARDLAHLRWHELISQRKDLPEYVKKHPVYYAGPAGTPPGKVIGSLGPTTAQRMDPYAEELLSRGYSLISLAKGNRTKLCLDACKRHGGFFLGTVGGAAALLSTYVTSNELMDYPEFGMEAVRLITVKDFPAFIVIDDKGNDLYK